MSPKTPPFSRSARTRFTHARRFASLHLACAFLGTLGVVTAAGQTPPPPPTTPLEVLRLDPALDTLIAPGATPERIATGFGFTEGPLWRHGRLWFVDGPMDKVRAVTSSGVVTDLLTSASGFPNYLSPNGMAPDRDGSVIMCEQDGRRVVRLSGPDDHLQVTTLFEDYDGHRLNSPNDIIFAKDGSFYFTDPPYGLKGMDKDPAKEQPVNGVYHYKNGKLTLVISDLTLPNGLNLSPDEKTLYVANSGPHQAIWKYALHPDGSVGPGAIFVDFPHPETRGVPDGMKLDGHGNLWATSNGGIRIITPDGKILGQIKLPETAANLAWGEDGRTLYITATHSIYRLKTNVLGKLPDFAKESSAVH